eukprot:scaffold157998_cov66-Cyclotella_meneghiniana.AAC.2
MILEPPTLIARMLCLVARMQYEEIDEEPTRVQTIRIQGQAGVENRRDVLDTIRVESNGAVGVGVIVEEREGSVEAGNGA